MSEVISITQSPTIGKLAEALAKAQGAMQPAKKGAENPFFSSKYADLPAVWEVARKPLADNGLAVVQTTEYSNGEICLVTTLAHASGEFTCGRYPVKPVKSDPQSLGSAITYARRYAFCAIIGVTSEGDDDDGNRASREDGGVENRIKTEKSIFKNATLRNTFCKNTIESFEKAETLDHLRELAKLNNAKLTEMMASGNEHDMLAVEEIKKRYQAACARFKPKKPDDLNDSSPANAANDEETEEIEAKDELTERFDAISRGY